jgi:energy-converting hydrogenase B subunit D
MTTLFIAVALVFVAVCGTVVAMTSDPGQQAVSLSVFGLLLALLLFVLQAPDVALSQIAVGTALVPLMVMLTVRKTGKGGR